MRTLKSWIRFKVLNPSKIELFLQYLLTKAIIRYQTPSSSASYVDHSRHNFTEKRAFWVKAVCPNELTLLHVQGWLIGVHPCPTHFQRVLRYQQLHYTDIAAKNMYHKPLRIGIQMGGGDFSQIIDKLVVNISLLLNKVKVMPTMVDA